MKDKFFRLLSVFITVMAVIASSTACWFLIYQPKLPKVLRKK
ncbi:MAG: cyclic lactone autoinducer peptide [Clostridia bacterium]|nr:cyclic lactone autoinducer peptide [Clostridia bacterium]